MIRASDRRHAPLTYSDVRHELAASRLVAETAPALTGLTATELERLLLRSRWHLPACTRRRMRLPALLRDRPPGVFLAAVTEDPAVFEDGRPVFAEVLTEVEFVAKGGLIPWRERRRAAAAVLDDVAFRSWEAEVLGADYVRPRPHVFTLYRRADGRIGRRRHKHAHVCDDYIERYGLENALGHPGMLEWYDAELSAAGIDPLTVVAMEIAEAKKMRLRVKAESHTCPNCAVRQRLTTAIRASAPGPVGCGGCWGRQRTDRARQKS
jgi:hypothetical protein